MDNEKPKFVFMRRAYQSPPTDEEKIKALANEINYLCGKIKSFIDGFIKADEFSKFQFYHEIQNDLSKEQDQAKKILNEYNTNELKRDRLKT